MFGVPAVRDGETWATATMSGRRRRLPWEWSSSFLPAVWALLVPLPSRSWWPLHPMVTLSQLLRKIHDAHSPIQLRRPVVKLAASSPISEMPPVLTGFRPKSVSIWDALKHSLEERI